MWLLILLVSATARFDRRCYTWYQESPWTYCRKKHGCTTSLLVNLLWAQHRHVMLPLLQFEIPNWFAGSCMYLQSGTEEENYFERWDVSQIRSDLCFRACKMRATPQTPSLYKLFFSVPTYPIMRALNRSLFLSIHAAYVRDFFLLQEFGDVCPRHWQTSCRPLTSEFQHLPACTTHQQWIIMTISFMLLIQSMLFCLASFPRAIEATYLSSSHTIGLETMQTLCICHNP